MPKVGRWSQVGRKLVHIPVPLRCRRVGAAQDAVIPNHPKSGMRKRGAANPEEGQLQLTLLPTFPSSFVPPLARWSPIKRGTWNCANLAVSWMGAGTDGHGSQNVKKDTRAADPVDVIPSAASHLGSLSLGSSLECSSLTLDIDRLWAKQVPGRLYGAH